MTTSGTAIFLDTSIQIARFIHSSEAKRKIEQRIRQYDFTVTSSVVRQEFKRRFLKEAKYVLDQLNRRNSYEEVYHHVVRLPDHSFAKLRRKKNICLQMCAQVFSGANDAELTERLKLYMRSLLTLGLDEFDGRVGHVIKGSSCACSTIPIRERRPFHTYDFGTDKCSETAGKCGVSEYLGNHTDELSSIREFLKNLPTERKTAEIKNSEAFLEDILKNSGVAMSSNPCLTVGDLMIALESIGIPTFYTLNGKESQFFCVVLRQILIVRPIDPFKEEIICQIDDENRPKF
ncbi:MAG: hypothetical protein ACHRXM_19380 [Isosphaerales bacterium]